MRCLFKTIKIFVKKTNMVKKMKIHKSWRLFHVDLFLKKTMKKSILDIKLFKDPLEMDYKRKNEANGGLLDYGTKSLTKV